MGLTEQLRFGDTRRRSPDIHNPFAKGPDMRLSLRCVLVVCLYWMLPSAASASEFTYTFRVSGVLNYNSSGSNYLFPTGMPFEVVYTLDPTVVPSASGYDPPTGTHFGEYFAITRMSVTLNGYTWTVDPPFGKNTLITLETGPWGSYYNLSTLHDDPPVYRFSGFTGPSVDGFVASGLGLLAYTEDGPDGSWLTHVGITDQAPPVAHPNVRSILFVGFSDGSGQRLGVEGFVTSWELMRPAVHQFSGFFPPIMNHPVVNPVKAGQAVPVRFSLNGNHGRSIFAPGFPTSSRVACSAPGGPAQEVSQTLSAGGSVLTYDAKTDIYTYVWKSERHWSNTCRRLTIELTDGSVHEAVFHFTR